MPFKQDRGNVNKKNRNVTKKGRNVETEKFEMRRKRCQGKTSQLWIFHFLLKLLTVFPSSLLFWKRTISSVNVSPLYFLYSFYCSPSKWPDSSTTSPPCGTDADGHGQDRRKKVVRTARSLQVPLNCKKLGIIAINIRFREHNTHLKSAKYFRAILYTVTPVNGYSFFFFFYLCASFQGCEKV